MIKKGAAGPALAMNIFLYYFFHFMVLVQAVYQCHKMITAVFAQFKLFASPDDSSNYIKA